MPAIVPRKQLSDRAKRRLRLAARLLRADGVKIHFPREQFYEQIQNLLAKLPIERWATLRGRVDRVEDYDLASETEVMRRAITRVAPTTGMSK